MKIEEYPNEIKEVKRQIAATKSDKRKRDLKKYLKRLQVEQYQYKKFQAEAKKKKTLQC